MDSLYRPLFQLQLFHEFYKNSDGEYTHLDADFDILPTERCRQEMRDQALLFRRTPGGFSVLYRGYRDGETAKPLVPLTESRKFSFQLIAKSPYITHYSSLPLEGKKAGIYYLSNLEDNKQSPNGVEELLLVKDRSAPYLSAVDEVRLRRPQFTYEFTKNADSATLTVEDRSANIVYSRALEKLDDGATTPAKNFSAYLDLTAHGTGRFTLKVDGVQQEAFYLDSSLLAHKPFGLMDIYYHPDVPAEYQFADSQGAVTAKTYTLRINCRETLWKYLVGLKYRADQEPSELEIVSSSFTATFTRQSSYRLADNTEVIPFDSGTTKLPLKYEPIKGIKLKRTIPGLTPDDSSTEETPLPNPEVSNIKKDQDNEKIYSEVFFYI